MLEVIPEMTPERMIWLGPPRQWTMIHEAVDKSGRVVPPRRVVVYCPPFAEEEKCSRRLYVELARKLAKRDIASIRFGYMGTGDSEGDFSMFTVETALDDIARTLLFARVRFPDAPLSLFGLRLGGALALRAAPQTAGVDRLALWEPVTNGRSYVRMNIRRKSIRQMINAGAAAEPALPTTDEIFDFDGYPVAQAAWNQIEALDAAAPAGWPGSALIISVSAGTRASAPCVTLAGALESSGVPTRLDHVTAQPFWNLLGLVDCPEILELTAGWLAQDSPVDGNER
ncbi:MAG TPA: alpha/beta hydrolase [Armatimonadota bacterium]|nr:alpha/beta hydrolase [Armatimonadota bacterium]